MITVAHESGYPKVALLRRGLSAILFIFSPLVFFLVNPQAAYPAAISGTAYTDEGVTPYAIAGTIRLLVNGTCAGTVTTIIRDYSITATINAGNADVRAL